MKRPSEVRRWWKSSATTPVVSLLPGRQHPPGCLLGEVRLAGERPFQIVVQAMLVENGVNFGFEAIDRACGGETEVELDIHYASTTLVAPVPPRMLKSAVVGGKYSLPSSQMVSPVRLWPGRQVIGFLPDAGRRCGTGCLSPSVAGERAAAAVLESVASLETQVGSRRCSSLSLHRVAAALRLRVRCHSTATPSSSEVISRRSNPLCPGCAATNSSMAVMKQRWSFMSAEPRP